MPKKITRNTRVTAAYSKKADLWKFSATMIAPIICGVLFGFFVTLILGLDYIQMILAMLWFPLSWAVVVGDRGAADFFESFQKAPKFYVERKRRSKLLRRD